MNVDTDFIKQIIEETIAATMTATRSQLIKQKMLKPAKDSAFLRTEKLLYNYNQFKQVVQNKLKQIESIESEGLARKSKSITSFRAGDYVDTDSEIEKVEAKIEQIQASIEQIQASIEQMNGYISIINSALNKVCNDQYFGIIRMKYFEGLTNEDMSFELGCDPSTVTRNKNRLINTMKIYIFTDDAIIELFD